VRLLLVTPSGSYRTAPFLAAALGTGCDVVVATDAAPAIAGSSLTVPFDDPELAADRLLAALADLDGVVGTDGAAVAVAAAVARRAGLPSNPQAAVSAAADKAAQRRAAATAGVRQPAFAVLADEDDSGWDAFPAVVKPLDRAASQGVLRVDDRTQLWAASEQVRGIVGRGAALIVERFVDGVEVIVEGLLRNGELEVLALFDKPDTPQGPTFPETLLVAPARLDDEVTARVVATARDAVAAVGLREGPVHVELKVEATGVWFLELAARTIGGLCARALDHGGLSLEDLVVGHALGLPLPARDAAPGGTGVLMLPVESSGRLVAVRGADAARAVDDVVGVELTAGPGQQLSALPSGDRYLGFVFARAATPDAVEVALRKAWALIEVDIRAS
jgi:biotin carboxylase